MPILIWWWWVWQTDRLCHCPVVYKKRAKHPLPLFCSRSCYHNANFNICFVLRLHNRVKLGWCWILRIPHYSTLHVVFAWHENKFLEIKIMAGQTFQGDFSQKTSQIFEKWIDQKALQIILILVPSCEVSIWWGGTTIKKGCRKASITYAL